jgi:hypothetical protein
MSCEESHIYYLQTIHKYTRIDNKRTNKGRKEGRKEGREQNRLSMKW